MDSAKQIEEQAAQWLLRREAPGWSDSDEQVLAEWLDASTANTVAFVRLEAAWKETNRLKALSAGTKRGSVPSPDEWQLSPFFEERQTASLQSIEDVSRGVPQGGDGARLSDSRRWRTLAASILLALAGGAGWYFWPDGPSYQTPVGGAESVPMSDGSRILLNTDTRIRVDVTQSERTVQLERGEAFFEVAKDPRRPFVVRAGDKRVIAVGTKFSVEREGDKVRVVVSEGTVRIDDGTKSRSAIAGSRAGDGASPSLAARREGGTVGTEDLSGEGVMLPAGSIARAEGDSVLVQEKPLQEVNDEYLSWRAGYLVFRDIPLAEAVAEFNRYNTRKILIEDPATAAIKVSGKFRSTNFEAFVRLLQDGFAIHAQDTDNQIVLSRM